MVCKMEIPTYKSLFKPMLWGGVPRNMMIFIILLSMLSIILLQSWRGILPIIALYALLVLLMRIDYKILPILQENLKYKDAYFPD